jgi:hypothetical protein
MIEHEADEGRGSLGVPWLMDVTSLPRRGSGAGGQYHSVGAIEQKDAVGEGGRLGHCGSLAYADTDAARHRGLISLAMSGPRVWCD